MDSNVPTRSDMINKLNFLIANQDKRVEVAAWAISIVDDDSVHITDQLVLDVLEKMGGVDLPTTDREFLYMVEDFEDWKNILVER